MIEVNLLPGQKRKAPGAGFKLRLPDFGALLANVKDPWLIAAVLAWVIVGGGAAALFVVERAKLAVAESTLETVKAEKRRFDVVIAQKRQSERIRDSLLAEIGESAASTRTGTSGRISSTKSRKPCLPTLG